MKKRILVSCMALILLFNTSLSVYASDVSGGGASRPSDKTSVVGFDNWSTNDKFLWWKDNLISIIGGSIGMVFNPFNWNFEHFMTQFHGAAVESQIADESFDYQDYVANSMGMNDDGAITFSDEFMDLMYLAVNEYIKEECTWYEVETMDYRNLSSSYFSSQSQYNLYMSYCTQNLKNTDNTVFLWSLSSDHLQNEDGAWYHEYYIVITPSLSNVEYYSYMGGGNLFAQDIEKRAVPTQDWNTLNTNGNLFKYYVNGNIEKYEMSRVLSPIYFDSRCCLVPLTDGKRTVRVYKTHEDLKMYSANQRPYYTTSDFRDYDVNGDNSCVLSESEIGDGSTLYGDISNHIVNNYENYNGLSEDALIKIVDMLLKNNNNDNDNDDDNNNNDDNDDDNDDSGGNGLGGLLGGIGALGDAILSILGKLIEYIGKALSLLTTTVDNIIEFVPSNITKLLTALFPFIPQEWVVAIELSLVLGVILGIVGLFKK